MTQRPVGFTFAIVASSFRLFATSISILASLSSDTIYRIMQLVRRARRPKSISSIYLPDNTQQL